MAGVIAIVADIIATIAFCYIVVDVITTCCWLMLLPIVWWLMFFAKYVMADVVGIVADGIATFLCDGLMLLPHGRWNDHMVGM